jgi:hypothetical protein
MLRLRASHWGKCGWGTSALRAGQGRVRGVHRCARSARAVGGGCRARDTPGNALLRPVAPPAAAVAAGYTAAEACDSALQPRSAEMAATRMGRVPSVTRTARVPSESPRPEAAPSLPRPCPGHLPPLVPSPAAQCPRPSSPPPPLASRQSPLLDPNLSQQSRKHTAAGSNSSCATVTTVGFIENSVEEDILLRRNGAPCAILVQPDPLPVPYPSFLTPSIPFLHYSPYSSTSSYAHSFLRKEIFVLAARLVVLRCLHRFRPRFVHQVASSDATVCSVAHYLCTDVF